MVHRVRYMILTVLACMLLALMMLGVTSPQRAAAGYICMPPDAVCGEEVEPTPQPDPLQAGPTPKPTLVVETTGR